jgi:murein DD-endopeptidase MepM/ murein hydrolase activator NlpD
VKSKFYLPKTFIIFLGAVFVATAFGAGFKFGLFLFPSERGQTQTNTQTKTENMKIDDVEAVHKIAKSEQITKLTENRGIEIDLTNNKAGLYDDGKLIKTLPLAYQSPENKWFQAPTGYFRIGVKREKHLSSLFPVFMPYSIQYYEDFFIHGIPYYKNGEAVSSQFTGGCLRFENDIAKEIFDFLKSGDQALVYKTFDDLKIKPEFHPPVDLENFFIERHFLNPYRQFRLFNGTDALEEDYYQHTGIDLRPTTDNPQRVYAIYNGKIAKIQLNDGNDHGLGNTVVIEHEINGKKIYSLYAHLASVNGSVASAGTIVKKGDIIGIVGNSGFDCDNYWRIGPDGCPSASSKQTNNNPSDVHLHFEIKNAPVLENPEGGKICEDKINGPKRFCYGYTPDYPQKYGYINPLEFLFEYEL